MSQSNQCYHKEPDGTPCPNPALPGETYCSTHQYEGSPGIGYTGGGGLGPQDPPIVISGGSVTIEFDDNVFPPVGRGRHANPNKKIRSVVVTVDGSAPQTIDVPNGKVTVVIHYRNP